MDNYLIYKHTSPSGKSYIGQTKDYDMRCGAHRRTSGCRGLSSAIKKYGWDNFQHEILMEGLSLDDANHWEPVLILEHNTLAPNGYNLMTGGGNSRHTEETRVKMSSVHKGRICSEETRAKMSIAKTGKPRVPHSDEAKAKMKVAKQNISDETKSKLSTARKGRITSAETKAKISAAKLGKKRGPYKKKSIPIPDE
jgi:group I intron endonuclease